MEIPIESVFLAQKWMISKCNIVGKPVVTATQMLESMITNPRPTRAECADVANAVLDGTDCVMLSGETANGEYSVDAVKMMCNTCLEAESMFDYDKFYDLIRYDTLSVKHMDPTESIASSAVKTARDLNAKAIVVLTETGNTARLVAKYRPRGHILAVTNHIDIARQVSGYIKGCVTSVVPSMHNNEAILEKAVGQTKELGWTKSGDIVICVMGSRSVAGSTNMLSLKVVH
jgi:pyruvate kinase